MSLTKEQQRKLGGGTAAVMIILLPLWNEFSEPGRTVWNAALFFMLIGLLVGAVLLQRYFLNNIDQVGDARFDTSNK
jgi:hypothetical protein